jgi:prepilin-type N-terminal cleavage/methylation domain-containing protein
LTARAGTTLVELLVVLAILAVTSSLASVAFRRADSARDASTGDQILALRREAIAAGNAITRIVRHGSTSSAVTALPDGRVLADSALGIDLSTGLRRAATP